MANASVRTNINDKPQEMFQIHPKRKKNANISRLQSFRGALFSLKSPDKTRTAQHHPARGTNMPSGCRDLKQNAKVKKCPLDRAAKAAPPPRPHPPPPASMATCSYQDGQRHGSTAQTAPFIRPLYPTDIARYPPSTQKLKPSFYPGPLDQEKTPPDNHRPLTFII